MLFDSDMHEHKYKELCNKLKFEYIDQKTFAYIVSSDFLRSKLNIIIGTNKNGTLSVKNISKDDLAKCSSVEREMLKLAYYLLGKRKSAPDIKYLLNYSDYKNKKLIINAISLYSLI